MKRGIRQIMDYKSIENYTLNDIAEIIREEIDAVFLIDAESDSYRAVHQKGIFADIFEKSGKYHDLIERLWFHFNNSSDAITEDYHVFVPAFGKFNGKYSNRIKNYKNKTNSCSKKLNNYSNRKPSTRIRLKP